MLRLNKKYHIMSNSETVEKLADLIGAEVYIDVAKWHLYLNDAHLAVPLAEQFYRLLTASGQPIESKTVTEVLTNTKIKVGDGKKEIPLSDLIPNSGQSKLLDILEEFSHSF